MSHVYHPPTSRERVATCTVEKNDDATNYDRPQFLHVIADLGS